MSDEGMSDAHLKALAGLYKDADDSGMESKWEAIGNALCNAYPLIIARLDAAERERDARLLDALREIARPLDCGCVPCTGQCRSAYAMQIEVEARQDIARTALTANHSAPVVEE